MTRTRKQRLAGGLISGLLFFAAPAAWVLFQQGGGAATYFECGKAGFPWGVTVGLLALTACVASAVRCWRLAERAAETQRFLLRVGAGAAVIFAFAILVMTVAMLVIPSCAR